MTLPLIALLQAGYYTTTQSQAAHYSAATMGMFVLIIVIGIAGYLVQARLQSVFRKYSRVQFPGGLTGAEVAEKISALNSMFRDLSLRSPERSMESQREHIAMIDAMLAGDTDEAVRVYIDHIEGTKRRVVGEFARRRAATA